MSLNPIALVANSVDGSIARKDHPGRVPAAEARTDTDVDAAAASDDAHLAARAVGAGRTGGEAAARGAAVDAETCGIRSAAAHAAAAGAAGRECGAGLASAARIRTGTVVADSGGAL